ncbi:hypothetical protein BU14_0422s0011 [Porphyra umbilicalis]|uniref:Uncharacterized protein n=1 Tax=Porphyra umbilicalis TaxID=2786 RepID=A0A1X6NVD1_PORUM|nr:hypothetical protein BU14_0422s0011 [Porphyra umbilicalis]|eukprot:OSX72579.1 hypothetical protein BU14_0422s0011 [Porphyra umbilicalis]
MRQWRRPRGPLGRRQRAQRRRPQRRRAAPPRLPGSRCAPAVEVCHCLGACLVLVACGRRRRRQSGRPTHPHLQMSTHADERRTRRRRCPPPNSRPKSRSGCRRRRCYPTCRIADHMCYRAAQGQCCPQTRGPVGGDWDRQVESTGRSPGRPRHESWPPSVAEWGQTRIVPFAERVASRRIRELARAAARQRTAPYQRCPPLATPLAAVVSVPPPKRLLATAAAPTEAFGASSPPPPLPPPLAPRPLARPGGRPSVARGAPPAACGCRRPPPPAPKAAAPLTIRRRAPTQLPTPRPGRRQGRGTRKLGCAQWRQAARWPDAG